MSVERDDLEHMLNASKAVLAYRNFEDSARIIFDEACALTGAKAGYIALLSVDGSENEVLFLEAGGMPCGVDPELPMPIRGLRAQCYEERRAVFHNDFMNSEHVAFMPAEHVILENVLFAPLVIDDVCEGVMGIANKEGDYTDHDIQLATALGEFAAIALNNSRMLSKLNENIANLETALAEIHTLRGILPICSHCKKIRDEKGYWHQVESYISKHSDTKFTHGLCEACLEKYYPDEPSP
ncbi:MAG: GAF domain-containing protein [Deltaproteobacteria bacterium]|nr:GAF domain-containing protein [Deltaproteobacteria bacterium]